MAFSKIVVYFKALRWTEFSKLFVFASFGNVWLLKFGNFLEKTEFLNSRNFCEKVWKKVWILTEIVRQFQKFWKNYVKFEFLSQNTLFLGQKVWKKFGKRVFLMFWNFWNCSISNFPKIAKKWRLTRTSKIKKNLFRLENQLESSVKSSECRALVYLCQYF